MGTSLNGENAHHRTVDTAGTVLRLYVERGVKQLGPEVSLEQVMANTAAALQLSLLYFFSLIVTVIMAALFVAGGIILSLRGKSNCMIEAYKAWQRGEYVLLRKTQWARGKVWRWPHFWWSADAKEWYEFVPIEAKRLRVFPPLIFEGVVRRVVLTLLACLFVTSRLDAAIARNGHAALGLQNPAPGGTYTASYTVTSGSTLLWVGCFGTNNDTWTTPTYNGVAMTKLGPVDNSSDRPVAAFYQFNPSSGAHNFSVSGFSAAASCNAADYTGTTTTIDSSNTGAAAASSLTVSTTVVTANSWVLVAQRENTGGATTWTNATSLNEPGDGLHTADSNGPVASGSYSVTVSNSGATQEKLIIASFAPSGGGTDTTPPFFNPISKPGFTPNIMYAPHLALLGLAIPILTIVVYATHQVYQSIAQIALPFVLAKREQARRKARDAYLERFFNQSDTSSGRELVPVRRISQTKES